MLLEYGVIAVIIIVSVIFIRYLIKTTISVNRLNKTAFKTNELITEENVGEYFYIKNLKYTKYVFTKKSKGYDYPTSDIKLKLIGITLFGAFGNFEIVIKGYLISDYTIHLNDVISEKEYLIKNRVKKLKRIL